MTPRRRKDSGIVDLLTSKADALKYLDSLIVSGTRSDEPSDSDLPLPLAPKARLLTFTFRLPPTTDAPSTILSLFSSTASLVDALHRGHISLPAIAASKIPRRRQEVSDAMLADATKDLAEAKEEARRKKLKAAQDERLKGLSPAQQEKQREKERKRNAFKAQQKNVKRK